VAGTRGLVDALTFVQSLGGGKTFDDIDKAAKMVTEMHNLGQSLGVNIADVNDTASWAGPILTALNATSDRVAISSIVCLPSGPDTIQLAVKKEEQGV